MATLITQHWADALVIILITAAIVGALLWRRHSRKKGGGCCGACAQCGAQCALRQNAPPPGGAAEAHTPTPTKTPNAARKKVQDSALSNAESHGLHNGQAGK